MNFLDLCAGIGGFSLRALGNAVVPQVVYEIGKAIKKGLGDTEKLCSPLVFEARETQQNNRTNNLDLLLDALEAAETGLKKHEVQNG
jgi:hypothetical protein